MKLHEFVNEIFDIAKANNVGVGVGTDMLLENVRASKATYKGANLNYKKLNGHIEELLKSRNDYDNVIHKNYGTVCALRMQNKRGVAKELVCNE